MKWKPASGSARSADDLCWELQGPRQQGQVLRALALMLPPHCHLMIEGGRVAPDVAGRYRRRRSAVNERIERDYLSEDVPVYHIHATPAILTELAELFETRPAEEVADHLKLYDGRGILFAWHDICAAGWPVLISDRLGAEAIAYLRDECDLDFQRT